MLNKPVYHFAPRKNWMNDPNGTVYRDGVYHMFYQYNPWGSGWGNVRWAYATSRNLIDWERKGIRLAPETDRGEQYCFSGCVVPDGEGYVLAYTSIGFEDWAIQQHARQRFARANADFSKIERLYGLDMTELSQPFPVHEWRDPFIFTYNDVKYLLLCGVCWLDGREERSVILYRSVENDCTKWQYVSVLFTDPENVVECPNMYIVGGRAALIYSTMTDRKVKCVAGDFDGSRLWERNRGVVDWSLKSFYATNLSDAEDGGKVLYGWLGEDLEQGDSPDGVSSGCLAIPRKIYLDGNYVLHFAPVEALSKLEREKIPFTGSEIVSDTLRARLKFETEGEVRFTLTEGERERMTVRVRNGEVIVGRVTKFSHGGESEERMKAGDGYKHAFDVLIDGSATEFFVDGTAVMSVRMYRADKPEKLFSLKEGKVKLIDAVRLDAANITGE